MKNIITVNSKREFLDALAAPRDSEITIKLAGSNFCITKGNKASKKLLKKVAKSASKLWEAKT